MIYTGVGSRETPDDILKLMESAAATLAAAGWTLRSGGALGADHAFELGSSGADPKLREVYLPWKGFNGKRSEYSNPHAQAFSIAEDVHPAWRQLSVGAKALHARNVHQILGPDITFPVLPDFVICYTSDGACTEAETSAKTGGTRTAIVLAHRNGVPVYNLRRPEHRQWLQDFLATLEPTTPARRRPVNRK